MKEETLNKIKNSDMNEIIKLAQCVDILEFVLADTKEKEIECARSVFIWVHALASHKYSVWKMKGDKEEAELCEAYIKRIDELTEKNKIIDIKEG